MSDCSCAQDAEPLTFGLCKTPECNHIGFLVIFFLLNIVTSSARVTTIPLQLRCKFTDLFLPTARIGGEVYGVTSCLAAWSHVFSGGCGP